MLKFLKNPKTNEKTLLSLAYVTYEVYTEPYLWLVRRRYNDFSLLRNILCKFYPRNLIPPLPEKKIGGNNDGKIEENKNEENNDKKDEQKEENNKKEDELNNNKNEVKEGENNNKKQEEI